MQRLALCVVVGLVGVGQVEAAIVSWGSNLFNQVSGTHSGTDFTAITSGGNHGLALTYNGSIVGWGTKGAGVKTFDSNGVEIAFYDEGRGDPVVVLHGFAADAEYMKGLSKSLVEADYRVITIDQRGHGRSGKPHKADAYGVEMADDVVRLLDHLRRPKAHVVGYSMGGCIVNNLRDRHPNRLYTVTIGGAGMSVTDWGMPGVNPEKAAISLRGGNGVKLVLRALAATDPDFDTEAKVENFNASIMKGNDLWPWPHLWMPSLVFRCRLKG